MNGAPRVFVDADACPVKGEICRVASRLEIDVTFVASSGMRLPDQPGVRLEIVPQGFDAADDWIVQHAGPGDIVVTGDVPLASRCVAAGAAVIAHDGREFTAENVGDALATRNLLADMRGAGIVTGGPAAFGARDRSRFLQSLDRTIHAIRRARR